MALAFESPKHTYEDYCKLPDDKRVELIEGAFFMSPSPFIRHQKISWRICAALEKWLEKHPLGQALGAPTDVVLSPFNVVQPDILFITNEHAGIITKANIQGAPDLVIEIISPESAKRDMFTKKHLYQTYGVQEYWIVDPESNTVTVMELQSSHFIVKGHFTKSDMLKSKLLFDFSLSLKELFR